MLWGFFAFFLFYTVHLKTLFWGQVPSFTDCQSCHDTKFKKPWNREASPLVAVTGDQIFVYTYCISQVYNLKILTSKASKKQSTLCWIICCQWVLHGVIKKADILYASFQITHYKLFSTDGQTSTVWNASTHCIFTLAILFLTFYFSICKKHKAVDH